MSTMKIYIVLFFLMIIWGFNTSLVKMIVDQFPPITITSFRIFTASLVVFLILGFLRRIRLPKKEEWIYVIVGSFSSVTIHHYFLAEGLSKTSASNGGLILGMGPLLTVILTMVFFKRKPTIIRLIGFLLGGLGVSLTILAGNGGIDSINIGDIDVFIAILSQAFSFILINKAAKTMDPLLLTGYMYLCGSLILFINSLWIEPTGLLEFPSAPPSIWIAFFVSAILGTGVGHMIYNYSIGQVGAAESSIFLNLSTFFALVGAAVLLNESILVAHFIGFVLIVSGVLLGSGTLEAWFIQRKNKNITEKRIM